MVLTGEDEIGLAVELGTHVVVQGIDGQAGEVVEGAVRGDADHTVDPADLLVHRRDAAV